MQLILLKYVVNIQRENTQEPPQPMPEIPETHLYYTKVLLPPELILYVIFYPFLAYVALVRKKKSIIVGPTR